MAGLEIREEGRERGGERNGGCGRRRRSPLSCRVRPVASRWAGKPRRIVVVVVVAGVRPCARCS